MISLCRENKSNDDSILCLTLTTWVVCFYCFHCNWVAVTSKLFSLFCRPLLLLDNRLYVLARRRESRRRQHNSFVRGCKLQNEINFKNFASLKRLYVLFYTKQNRGLIRKQRQRALPQVPLVLYTKVHVLPVIFIEQSRCKSWLQISIVFCKKCFVRGL